MGRPVIIHRSSVLLATESYEGRAVAVGYTEEPGRVGYWLTIEGGFDELRGESFNVSQLPRQEFALHVAHGLIDGVSLEETAHLMHQAIAGDPEHAKRSFTDEQVGNIKRCRCLKGDDFFDTHKEIERG